jgi:hypothetical protein
VWKLLWCFAEWSLSLLFWELCQSVYDVIYEFPPVLSSCWCYVMDGAVFFRLVVVQLSSPRVNLCHALGTTCNCLWALSLFGYFYDCPSFPFASHLRRVPGRLHWSYTVLLPCLVDVEKLRGKEGVLWLLVLVGGGSFHLRLLHWLSSREMSGVAGFSQ